MQYERKNSNSKKHMNEKININYKITNKLANYNNGKHAYWYRNNIQ